MLSSNLSWYQRIDEIDFSQTFTTKSHANWGFLSITCKLEKVLVDRFEKSLQSDRITSQWGILFFEKGCLEMNRKETLRPTTFSMVLP